MGSIGVIVVAAGRGSRMGTAESKQYLLLKEKPIVVHTLEVFERIAEVSSVVLVVGAQDVERNEAFVRQYRLSKVKAVVAGGRERQESVYFGLQALPARLEWILVHDGVRPFVQEADVLRCWRKARDTGAAVLAVPVKDTIKVVDAGGEIRSTPDRSSLWAIHTPQAFRADWLRDAHEQAREHSFLGTDDAMVVERAGHTVHVVEGSYTNVKITTPEDLQLAEWLLSARQTETKGEETK
ncbi:2-C-methyl-D-erythritol 4-phosphate cytidylyltransferase [Paenibacillus sp. y28]|uniref:2-C-methyl-D-erythritol 4-phosphate cytidylyltransferase n=1 Tax=Paenibacillus sp. y28 TaxID=3129110 RepID=UPI00301740B4